jgi:hypothetical protein
VQDDEDPNERLDRELIELLNELRVALPGVQVLLAFLLTVPFTQRFTELGSGDRGIYFVAVIAAALASACFIAPSAHHRVRFRQGVKESIIRTANVCAIVGMVFVAVAVGASAYLVTDLLYAGGVAAIVGGGLVAVTLLLWFLVPFAFNPNVRDR